MNEQRDVHEAFNLMLEIFNMVCRKPKFGSDFSDIPEFTDYYFCGIFKKKFTCTSCHEDNTFFENFRSFIIQPSEDIATFLGKQHVEQKLLTCEKCHLQNLQHVSTKIHEFPRILMLQISRFSTSSIHSRHRKNNHCMSVYDKVRFGFVDYELFALIEHHGVLADSGHYTCIILHGNCWFHCNNINIEKVVLPSSSQNTYLFFFQRK